MHTPQVLELTRYVERVQQPTCKGRDAAAKDTQGSQGQQGPGAGAGAGACGRRQGGGGDSDSEQEEDEESEDVEPSEEEEDEQAPVLADAEMVHEDGSDVPQAGTSTAACDGQGASAARVDVHAPGASMAGGDGAAVAPTSGSQQQQHPGMRTCAQGPKPSIALRMLLKLAKVMGAS